MFVIELPVMEMLCCSDTLPNKCSERPFTQANVIPRFNLPISQNDPSLCDVFDGELCLPSNASYSSYGSGEVVPFQWLHYRAERGRGLHAAIQ